MKPEHYYFAYGSNMNIAQMKKRCPGAVDLGPAVLHDHVLCECMYADIDKAPGLSVNGVLYLVTEEHLAELDYREGHPNYYERKSVEVSKDGETYRAWVYEMTPATKWRRSDSNLYKYSGEYRNRCSTGAKEHGIPDQFNVSGPVALIVYGTLMTGERNHYLCRNAIRIEPCTINGTLYDTGYGYPAFEPETGGAPVRAEYIQILHDDWTAIDHLEGYPHLYDRRRCAATLDDGSTVFGWVYIMKTLPDGADIIVSGDWKQRG